MSEYSTKPFNGWESVHELRLVCGRYKNSWPCQHIPLGLPQASSNKLSPASRQRPGRGFSSLKLRYHSKQTTAWYLYQRRVMAEISMMGGGIRKGLLISRNGLKDGKKYFYLGVYLGCLTIEDMLKIYNLDLIWVNQLYNAFLWWQFKKKICWAILLHRNIFWFFFFLKSSLFVSLPQLQSDWTFWSVILFKIWTYDCSSCSTLWRVQTSDFAFDIKSNRKSISFNISAFLRNS